MNLGLVNLLLCLLDSLSRFFLLLELDLHLAGDHLILSHSVLKLLLEAVQNLNGFTRVKLEGQEFFVSLVGARVSGGVRRH